MRELPQHISDMLSQQVISLCTCWKVKLESGEEIGYTSHNADLEVDGLTYRSASGLTPSAVSANLGTKASVADMHGVGQVESELIENLIRGRYDNAEVEVFLVDPNAPNDGKVVLQRGRITEISLEGAKFTVQLKGLISTLASTTIVEVTSPTCRAKLGDERCKVDLESYAVNGTITSLESQTVFYDTNNNQPDGWFNQGKLVLTSGETCEINTWDQSDHKFTLFLPPKTPLESGMAYTAYPGCDKTLATCRDKFSNVVNFRGEPYLPGRDRALRYV